VCDSTPRAKRSLLSIYRLPCSIRRFDDKSMEPVQESRYATIIIRPVTTLQYYVRRCRLYRPSSVICLSVGLSRSEPRKNGWSDRDDFCVDDSSGPKEPTIRYSRALPAKYCIVGIPHNIAI